MTDNDIFHSDPTHTPPQTAEKTHEPHTGTDRRKEADPHHARPQSAYPPLAPLLLHGILFFIGLAIGWAIRLFR